MAQCSICSNPKVRDINRRLLTGRQVQETANDFGVKRGALYEHLKHHLPWRSRRRPPGVTIAEQMDDLKWELKRLQVLGEAGDDVSKALAVVRARQSLLELEARLGGHLDPASMKKKILGSKPLDGNYEVKFVDGHPVTREVKDAV